MTDYQIFDLNQGKVENIGPRMQQKLHALQKVLPEDLSGKSVLDIGCDHGFWSFLCAQRGARAVLGLDRGRKVSGEYVDLSAKNNALEVPLCEFKKTNLGQTWDYFGKHDISLLMSLYHHIYHQCEEHLPIWYWLHRHTKEKLIWENPTDSSDSVVKMNVAGHLHPKYTKDYILLSASRYFDYEYIGPAEHEPTRSVYVFTPKKLKFPIYTGAMVSGAGGAAKAFEFKGGRRIKEIEKILNVTCFPGSLNLQLSSPFNWNAHYVRARVLDVAQRGKGLDVNWIPRWARFYPVIANGKKAFVFKFEGDVYPENFIELIAEKRLRDSFDEIGTVTVQTLV